MLLALPRRFLFERIAGMIKDRGEFRKEHAKFGRDRTDTYRTEYEQEVKKRTELKLNWGVKNRWEQRMLDDIIKNEDVRNIGFRDFAKQA